MYMRIFEDVMEPGVELVYDSGFMIPEYLTIKEILHISNSDHLDPTSLLSSTAYVYNQNLYLTDDSGNIAFIDCHLCHVSPTKRLRLSHSEYRKAGSKDRDAGHLGLSLGQHPSIAMEQDRTMNRYGIWRIFERYWVEVLNNDDSAHLLGVFAEGCEGTYSPFWCIHEEINGEVNEYVFTNDDMQ